MMKPDRTDAVRNYFAEIESIFLSCVRWKFVLWSRTVVVIAAVVCCFVVVVVILSLSVSVSAPYLPRSPAPLSFCLCVAVSRSVSATVCSTHRSTIDCHRSAITMLLADTTRDLFGLAMAARSIFVLVDCARACALRGCRCVQHNAHAEAEHWGRRIVRACVLYLL